MYVFIYIIYLLFIHLCISFLFIYLFIDYLVGWISSGWKTKSLQILNLAILKSLFSQAWRNSLGWLRCWTNAGSTMWDNRGPMLGLEQFHSAVDILSGQEQNSNTFIFLLWLLLLYILWWAVAASTQYLFRGWFILLPLHFSVSIFVFIYTFATAFSYWFWYHFFCIIVFMQVFFFIKDFDYAEIAEIESIYDFLQLTKLFLIFYKLPNISKLS